MAVAKDADFTTECAKNFEGTSFRRRPEATPLWTPTRRPPTFGIVAVGRPLWSHNPEIGAHPTEQFSRTEELAGPAVLRWVFLTTTV
jgi:hypothetical protein